MQVRDRIKEFRRVPASRLQPNPKNWRTHPDRQRNALRGLLAEVGYADALLARELPDGSLELIDGHLRAETTPDQQVPVLILDVSEEEADKILATLDPLAELADADNEKLTALLGEVETGNESLMEMLSTLAEKSGIIPPLEDTPAGDESDRLVESYQILVECRDERQQLDLLARLESEGYRCRALIC